MNDMLKVDVLENALKACNIPFTTRSAEHFNSPMPNKELIGKTITLNIIMPNLYFDRDGNYIVED